MLQLLYSRANSSPISLLLPTLWDGCGLICAVASCWLAVVLYFSLFSHRAVLILSFFISNCFFVLLFRSFFFFKLFSFCPYNFVASSRLCWLPHVFLLARANLQCGRCMPKSPHSLFSQCVSLLRSLWPQNSSGSKRHRHFGTPESRSSSISVHARVYHSPKCRGSAIDSDVRIQLPKSYPRIERQRKEPFAGFELARTQLVVTTTSYWFRALPPYHAKIHLVKFCARRSTSNNSLSIRDGGHHTQNEVF